MHCLVDSVREAICSESEVSHHSINFPINSMKIQVLLAVSRKHKQSTGLLK